MVRIRRLFINVISLALIAHGNWSWSYQSQVLVAVHLLKNVFAYRTNDGQHIRPKDVMLILRNAGLRALVGRLIRGGVWQFY